MLAMVEQKAKRLAQIFQDVVFYGLPKEAKGVIGSEAAQALIFGVVMTATKEAIKMEHIPAELIKSPELTPKFDYCYELLASFGFPFEREVVSETEERYIEKVVRCPHIKYTKLDPIACIGCGAMKKAILEAALNREIEIIRERAMSLGDPYCLFTVKKR